MCVRLGGNNPSFWFSVTRNSTGDVLFSTKDTKLVFENQFVEFVSSLPEDYNCECSRKLILCEIRNGIYFPNAGLLGMACHHYLHH